jgi:predicted glycoside hydrolase/deacetylase ChbG (UPF0249 family)
MMLVIMATGGLSSAQEQPTLAEKLGYEKETILLIVHADDIGLAQSVNAASVTAFEKGGISSGSMMVPCPWTPDFARYYKEHQELDVGIHITLNAEWENYRWGGVLPSTEIPSLLDEEGNFYPTVEEVALHADPAEVEKEVRAQIERALALGINPTHLDTHMGSIGAKPELFQIYLKLGKEYHLPVFIPRNWIQSMPEEFRASLAKEHVLVDRFYMMNQVPLGGSWDKAYESMVEQMEPGLNLMIVHVAYDNAEMQAVTINHADFGATWRQKDLDFVTGNAFREMLKEHHVRLVTWKEIKAIM